MSKVLNFSVSYVVIPAALATLTFASGCTKAAHDVGCADFLDMTGSEQDEVVESFLDDHPVGRLTFGNEESQQSSMASMSLHAYCMQNPDSNIDDLEPNLIPGL